MCRTCSTPSTNPTPRALTQPNHGYWVAVQATFTCNACRFEVPLNHFELGDGVICTRCGLEQRYEANRWRELIDFAHSVGDFGSPGPEGRFPDPVVRLARPKPFADLGSSNSKDKDAGWAIAKQHRASPGNPLCTTCRSPVVVVAKHEKEKALDVACSSGHCKVQRRYEIPPKLQASRLAGVLADEHEADRNEASLVQESGVSVLRCPNCAAPLVGVKDEDGVVTCGYCKVPCRISTHTHARAGHKSTPTKTWWLYFDQPSSTRRRLLNEAKQEAAREEKHQKQRQQQEQQYKARSEQPSYSAPSKPKRGKAAAKQTAERRALWPLLAVAIVGPIVGVIAYAQPFAKKEPKPTENARPSASEVLLKYSFAMSAEQSNQLFGIDAKQAAAAQPVRFREPGIFKEGTFTQNMGPRYNMALQAGKQFDAQTTITRAAKVSPHRLEKSNATNHEINRAKTLLRISSQPNIQSVQVSTWNASEERALALAEAFLAAAKYAALSGPELTAEQLRLVNGPPLSDANRFDFTSPIENAKSSFTKLFPDGACQTSTSINLSAANAGASGSNTKTQLTCEVEVDHPVIDKLTIAWPSADKTRAQSAILTRGSKKRLSTRKPIDPKPCLMSTLGAGETKVVDHASGRSETVWQLDKRGDRATLDDDTIKLTAPDATPTEPARWIARFPAIVQALDHCTE